LFAIGTGRKIDVIADIAVIARNRQSKASETQANVGGFGDDRK
jgi:1,4-dihydroxy-2-naphthoyl-CoA synthase